MLEIINEVVNLTEGKLGTRMSVAERHQVLEAVAAHYGGERHYMPKLPKLQVMVRIEAAGTAASVSDLATAMGLSVRQIRRVVRGR